LNYVLIKRHNPGYDFFVFRYFRENGIDVSENTPFETIKQLATSFAESVESDEDRRPPYRKVFGFRNKLTPPQRLLWDYSRSWELEPDARPSVDSYFSHAVGGKMPDFNTLKELESQLPSQRGKLLFTKDESAADIVSFYKRYLRDPIRKALNEGVSGLELLKYFSLEDHQRLPNSSAFGTDKVSEEARKIAKELLASMDRLTPEDIARDIDLALNDHWKDSEHPRSGVSLADNKTKMRFCEHKSNFVQLNCYHYVDEDTRSLYLKPSRGFRVWVKHKWEADYADVIFPHYTVIKT